MATLSEERYIDTNTLWQSTAVPDITRHEAERAAKALYRKFGRKEGFPRQRSDVKFREGVRRCWVSPKMEPGVIRALNKGWPRLVHDISHRIFEHRYPQFQSHHPLHAKLEYDIAEFVITQTEWLRGFLKPKTKPPASAADKRAAKLAKVDESLKLWDSKLRRAQNAIKKLKRQRARLAA